MKFPKILDRTTHRDSRFKYKVTLPAQLVGNVDPREQWLAEHMYVNYDSRWDITGYRTLVYWFADKDDYMEFVLVWG